MEATHSKRQFVGRWTSHALADNGEDLFTSLSDEIINQDESIDVENERTDDLATDSEDSDSDSDSEEDENIVSMIQTLLMRL